MLTFVQKMAATQPDIVFGDGKERSRDTPEMRKFCRKLAADGMVLLKNTGNVLPITPTKASTVAVIGPNAKGTIISGGGSAALKPTYVVKPFDGIVQNAPSGVEIKYEVGCYCALHGPGRCSFITIVYSPQISPHTRGLPQNAKWSPWLAVHLLHTRYPRKP